MAEAPTGALVKLVLPTSSGAETIMLLLLISPASLPSSTPARPRFSFASSCCAFSLNFSNSSGDAPATPISIDVSAAALDDEPIRGDA